MFLLMVGCQTQVAPPPAAEPAHPHPVHRETTPPPTGPAPRVYYDGVHGARHLFNRDNRRYRLDYHTISGWFRFIEALEAVGYDVHGEEHDCFDYESLKPYDVFVIGEQTYHARFMEGPEREDLMRWVHDGGGLLLTVEHTNAHYMADVFNLVAKPLPVKARYDSICDTESSDPTARDWVRLQPTGPHPVVEGVDELWFYNGCSLDTEHGVLSSTESAWSDKYVRKDKPVHNGNKRKDPGELTGRLHGVAAFEYGKGRVVVIGDHNGLSNTELYVADHHRFALNAISWLAGTEEDPAYTRDPYTEGYDLLIHNDHAGGLNLHRKGDKDTYRLFFNQWGKEPQLRAWADTEMAEGHDALVLGAPQTTYDAEQLATIDAYLAEGKPVIWLASLPSLGSPASVQLQKRFGIDVQVDEKAAMTMRRPLEVTGPRNWTEGIFRLYVERGTPTVRVGGAEAVVQLRHGAWHIEQVHSDRPVLYDVISRKAVGPGSFWVVAPLEIFDDRSLPDLAGQRQDVARQQAAELAIRLAKIPVGDTTVLHD